MLHKSKSNLYVLRELDFTNSSKIGFRMKNIIAIGGSISNKSINKQLAHSTAKKLTNINLNLIDLNDFELPLFSIQLEEKGMPDNANKLNELFNEADGFIVSLAEHNGSFSAGFKNTTDWISRIDSKPWKNKPMLLMATSPGKRGGMSVLNTAKTTYPFHGANIIADFSLPSFYDNFSEGSISNSELEDELNKKVKLFEESL